jgi:hypothetical protein
MMRKVDEKKILWSEKGVKQGHFVVIATQFCIELEYLDHPEFVKLLKQAEEEFRFSQVGALEIPWVKLSLFNIIFVCIYTY